MTIKTILEYGALVGMAIGAYTYFETAHHASAQYETIAADAETERLATRLELLKIRIDRFVETSRIRALTDSEQIELRSLEAERAALLNRLASKA